MAVEETAQQNTAVTDLPSYQTWAMEQQAANNAWSAQQAQKQMDFQREMSDTAHQREVKDLQAAGLNPILSVNSGASVPNGAAGDTDTSAAGNVGAILQQVLQAQSAREVAGMYNAATLAAASIAANASMYGSDMSYWNSEDHPKTLEEVAARIMYKDSGNTGSHAPSNGPNSHTYQTTTEAAAQAGAGTSAAAEAAKNWIKGAVNRSDKFSNNQQKAFLNAGFGKQYYEAGLRWLQKNNLYISDRDKAYFRLICLAKGQNAGYEFLQQLIKRGRISKAAGAKGKF